MMRSLSQMSDKSETDKEVLKEMIERQMSERKSFRRPNSATTPAKRAISSPGTQRQNSAAAAGYVEQPSEVRSAKFIQYFNLYDSQNHLNTKIILLNCLLMIYSGHRETH